MDDDDCVLVALREAAARLGVSCATVKQMIRSGKLRGRKFAGELYVPAEDLTALEQLSVA